MQVGSDLSDPEAQELFVRDHAAILGAKTTV